MLKTTQGQNTTCTVLIIFLLTCFIMDVGTLSSRAAILPCCFVFHLVGQEDSSGLRSSRPPEFPHHCMRWLRTANTWSDFISRFGNVHVQPAVAGSVVLVVILFFSFRCAGAPLQGQVGSGTQHPHLCHPLILLPRTTAEPLAVSCKVFWVLTPPYKEQFLWPIAVNSFSFPSFLLPVTLWVP